MGLGLGLRAHLGDEEVEDEVGEDDGHPYKYDVADGLFYRLHDETVWQEALQRGGGEGRGEGDRVKGGSNRGCLGGRRQGGFRRGGKGGYAEGTCPRYSLTRVV